MNLDIYRELLRKVEIIDTRLVNLSSLEDLICFEENTSIILPCGYKEFCQAFGSGTFGDFVDIYGLPRMDVSEEMLSYLKQSLDRIEQWESPPDLSEYKKLLNSSLVFGGSSREESFLWDLRTYRDSDKSYDIYLTCIDYPEFFLVGRDFFEFIENFCLGTKAFEILPEELHPLPEEIYPIFTR